MAARGGRTLWEIPRFFFQKNPCGLYCITHKKTTHVGLFPVIKAVPSISPFGYKALIGLKHRKNREGLVTKTPEWLLPITLIRIPTTRAGPSQCTRGELKSVNFGIEPAFLIPALFSKHFI